MPRSFLCALLLAGTATLAAQQTPSPTAAAPQARPSFDEFLAGIRAEAAAKGISQATIDTALSGIEPLPVAVERDRSQPEEVVSLDTYVSRRLTTKIVTRARTESKENAKLLRAVHKKYGIPSNILIAVWGAESNFGAFTGSREIVPALATLAYDGRRALFRTELFNALKIVDAGHITVDQLKGSWAGAMGQPQFMPSSYLKYAVDFDNDGRADIWKTKADVFASIGNYLKEYGWKDGGRWGREVSLTDAVHERIAQDIPMRTGSCKAEREMTEARPLTEWARLGVKAVGGKALPKSNINASLVRGHQRHFLVYANYNALLGYNCSNSYAIGLGLLADRIPALK